MVTEEGTCLFATKSTAASLSSLSRCIRNNCAYTWISIYVWYLLIYRLLLAYTHTFHLFLFLYSFVYDGDECGGRAPSSLSRRSYPDLIRSNLETPNASGPGLDYTQSMLHFEFIFLRFFFFSLVVLYFWACFSIHTLLCVCVFVGFLWCYND